MAGNISKYFYEATKNKTCADFHHPGFTCTQAALMCCKSGLLGSMKFYLPISLLPLLFKIKKWNELQTWKEFLRNYSRCIFSGFFITTTGFILFCIAYNIFKTFYLPLTICLPASLGAIFCTFLPEKNLHIDGLGLFNMYIEFVIKQSKLKFVEWCRRSKVGGTAIYALMNSAIIYCLFKLSSKRFWFTSVDNQDAKDENGNFDEKFGKCVHGNLKCSEYLKKEIKQTSIFAFGVSTFKLIFPRISSIVKNPMSIFKLFFTKFEFGLFAYLFASNGIFKALFCRLNRDGKFSKDVNCLIAAAASSLAYLFYPRYIVFTMGLTTMIEMCYKYLNFFYESKGKKLPGIMKFINKLPLCELVYIFAIGITFQLRVLYPHLTNFFVHRMMAVGSGGRSDRVAENYAGIMMGLQ